jgi:hypothetical protein
MKPTSEIPVTLSGELFRHSRGLAAALDVPLHWMVAGLVCDTIEGLAAGHLAAGTQACLTPTPHARRPGTRRTAVLA